MNQLQERKLSMYEVVKAFLANTDASIIAKMPLMDQAQISLTAKIATISALGSKQNQNRKGETDSKDYLKETLVSTTLDISKKVKAYANNSGNMVLFQEVNYTKSALNRLADNILVMIATNIYDCAKNNVGDLGNYGITSVTIDAFRQDIDNYDVSIPKPRTGIVLKKNATTTLRQYFAATDELLKENMDILVGIIQKEEPDFFINYTNSRKIINPGHSPLAVRVKVTDSNNNPIPDVTATILNYNKSFKTKTKGQFYIKSFPQGNYTFTFSKEGYTTQEIPVVVATGQRTDINIVLENTPQ